jgi:hypothetical protein
MPKVREPNLQYMTDEKGTRTAVVLPIAEFDELLEDISDLAVVAERRGESTISHDELLAELKPVPRQDEDDISCHCERSEAIPAYRTEIAC